MTENEIRERALEAGFTNAVFLNTSELVFDAALREYCVMNTCGNYDRNYACPPDCGTSEEMEAKVKSFQRALVLQTIQPVDSIMDEEQTKEARKAHNMISREFLELMEDNGIQGKFIMAGPCTVCGVCAKIEGKPCRFPKQIASCLSAYCIDAGKMAEYCGLPYWCGMEAVPFFSVFLI